LFVLRLVVRSLGRSFVRYAFYVRYRPFIVVVIPFPDRCCYVVVLTVTVHVHVVPVIFYYCSLFMLFVRFTVVPVVVTCSSVMRALFDGCCLDWWLYDLPYV